MDVFCACVLWMCSVDVFCDVLCGVFCDVFCDVFCGCVL